MGVPARAAVEAPEGERASEADKLRRLRTLVCVGAQPRPDFNKRQRLLMLRGNGWHCAFRRFASLLGRRRFFEWRGSWQSSGAVASREGCCLSAPAQWNEAGEGDHAKHGGGGMRRRGSLGPTEQA